MKPLTVLVIDDERPALDELTYLLADDDRIGEVHTSSSATDGLRILHEGAVDAVFLDIQMPGLTGLELGQVLSRFRTPPPIVFVTAHEQHAVEAFDLRAVDYVLKPVRAERLTEAVRRVVGMLDGVAESAPVRDDTQVAVERGGVTGSSTAPTSPTSRRRATTHGCTPRRSPTWCAARCRPSRRSGPRPASCASTARCWSRCRR